MTAPKHTPGPWFTTAEGIRMLVRGADYTIVACRHRLPGETNEANMRLIAAAPELYEALAPFAEFERVRSAMGGNTAKDGVVWGVHSSAGDAEITTEDLRRAIAALAKARGEGHA